MKHLLVYILNTMYIYLLLLTSCSFTSFLFCAVLIIDRRKDVRRIVWIKKYYLSRYILRESSMSLYINVNYYYEDMACFRKS